METIVIQAFAPKRLNDMHSIEHKKPTNIYSRFLTFPSNKLHMSMPVQVGSHLRDFGALIIRTFGLCGMFLFMFQCRGINIQHNNCL